jgi:SAM-dependent methyltransferase
MMTVDFARLDLEPGDRVLDLGCGNGRHVRATRRVPSVAGVALDLGLDEVRATVETLTRMDDTAPQDGGSISDAGPWLVVQGDTFHLPFADRSFDCVIASEVLEHLPDDGAAIAEMSRVLRSGGLLAVSVPRFGPEAVCWALSREYHSNEGGHIRIYREQTLRRKLSDHGYRIFARHHSHALHSPFWWLRCLVGLRRESSLPVRWYHGLLVWDMVRGHWSTRLLDRALNPLIGKSLVLYARKVETQ